MKKYISIILIIFLGCNLDSNSSVDPFYKVYVSNQSQDHVAVINAKTGELEKNIKVPLKKIQKYTLKAFSLEKLDEARKI